MLVFMSQLENKFLHVSYCIISAAPDLSPSVAVTFFCFLTMETKNDIYLALGVHVFQLVYNIKKSKTWKQKPWRQYHQHATKAPLFFLQSQLHDITEITCSHAIIHAYFSQGRIIKRAFGKLKVEHVYLGRHSFSKMLPS
jgi:hypothetical protein